MKLGKYIHILLQQNETVIVPDFGAFVSSYKPAQVDEDTDEILPPSKEITFNRKIRNNDGLLVGFISDREKISYFEALEKVEAEREDILYRLDKGEKVSLENMGRVYLGENREIQFEPESGENLLLDAFGLETTSLNESTNDWPKEESSHEDVDSEDEYDSIDLSTESEKTPGASVSEESIKSETKEAASSEGEKKKGWWWFLLILIPLVGAGIFILRKEKDPEGPEVEMSDEPLMADSLVVEEDSISTADAFQTDSLDKPAVDTAETIVEAVDSANYFALDTSKYYLVSGSFKETENAEKHFQQLKNKGYHPFHLGKQGNFYFVGIDVFNTDNEAYRAQYDFLDKHPDSGVWVYIPE